MLDQGPELPKRARASKRLRFETAWTREVMPRDGEASEQWSDSRQVGLYLRVTAKGSRTYYAIFRPKGSRPRRVRIGDANDLTVTNARRLCGKVIADAKPRAPDAAKATIREAFEAWQEQRSREVAASTIADARYQFNRHVLAEFGDRKMKVVDEDWVVAVLTAAAKPAPNDRSPKAAMWRADGLLRSLGSWLTSGADEGWVPKRPITRKIRRRFLAPKKERRRRRTEGGTSVLSDAEVKTIWRACEGVYPDGALLRALMLTGCRTKALSMATWDEVDRVPGFIDVGDEEGRKKGSDEYLVPITDQLRALLRGLPRFKDCPYLFTADGKRPLTQVRLEPTGLRVRAKRKRGRERSDVIANFMPKDVRKLVTTRLAQLGVAEEVRKLCLNHVLDSVEAENYQAYRFRDEKRAAMQAWADELERIVADDDPQLSFLDELEDVA